MSRKRKHKAKPQASTKAASTESTLDTTGDAPAEAEQVLEAASAAPDEELLAEGSGPVDASPIEVREGEGEVEVRVREVEEERVADDETLLAMDEPVEHLADDLERRMDSNEAEAQAEAERSPQEPPDSIEAAAEGAEPIDAIQSSEEIDGEAIDPAAVLPTSAASLDPAQLKQLVEALVFASDKPLTVVRLRQLTRVSDTRRLEAALAELAEDYRDRGLVLQQVSGGYQFRTRTQWAAWVQQLIAGRPVRLTRAQLETLAIIAYRQPITRPEIDEIRGVDSSATLKLLIDRALIRILGKKEEVGRPMLYGTTREFLDFFSLGDLRELPTLREYSELTDESRQVMSDRLGIAPEEAVGNPPDDAAGDLGVAASADVDELAATPPGDASASELIAAMRAGEEPAVAFEEPAPDDVSASELIAAMRVGVEPAAEGSEVPELASDSLEAVAVDDGETIHAGETLDATPASEADEAEAVDAPDAGEPTVLAAADAGHDGDAHDRTEDDGADALDGTDADGAAALDHADGFDTLDATDALEGTALDATDALEGTALEATDTLDVTDALDATDAVEGADTLDALDATQAAEGSPSDAGLDDDATRDHTAEPSD